MTEPFIWVDAEHGGKLPLSVALPLITDKWIADGWSCHETIMDLRNALTRLMAQEAVARLAPQACHADIVNIICDMDGGATDAAWKIIETIEAAMKRGDT